MSLIENMPDWLAAHLAEPDIHQKDLLAVLEGDLNSEGNFSRQWLVVDRETLRVVSQRNGRAVTAWTQPLSAIDEFSISSGIGSSFLQAKIAGRNQNVIRYSNTHARKFSRLSKALNELDPGSGIPEDVREDSETACPGCGTPFMRDSRVCPQCMSKTRVFLRLLGYVRRYRALAATVTLLLFAITVLRFAPPYIIRQITDDVFNNALGLAFAERKHLLLLLAGTLLGSYLLGMFLEIAQGRITALIGARMVFDFRKDAYTNLQRLSLSYYDKRQVGALMSRVTSDTEMVQNFVVEGIQFIFINLLTLLLIAGFMFAANPKMAILALITTPVVVYSSRYFIGKLHTLFHRYFDFRSRFHAVVNDTLSGIRVVKAFAREEWEIEKYQKKNDAFCEASVDLGRSFATVFPILHFMSTIGSVLVWLIGGYFVLGAEITIGTFFMFVYLLGMLQGPLQGLSRIHHWISRSMAGAERIFEILDTEPEVKDPENPKSISGLRGEIRFENVTFGYDRYKPVLKNVSFQVVPGEMVGLVGHSGAGKTTLINLVCRFYDPDEGAVTIDGIDLRDVRRSDYGARLGVVLQESFLFNGTIKENICYGDPDASAEEIMSAAAAANAHDFIMERPDGYDSQVGESGGLLSIGEKQRIAIARAILHDPAVLILDEATASVDTETEKQIQEALKQLVKNRTVFAIAHRLSTLQMADRLIVLKDGRIIESGTHAQLMEEKGEYEHLVTLQSDMSSVMGVGG